jgi:hypothetical protein
MSLVVRQRLRSIVMKCPDGCGDDLTLNADPRAGKAWRVYRRNGAITLYPSVWRTEGCKSHFIVLRRKIVWADASWKTHKADEDELRAVLAQIQSLGPISYWTIADAIDLLPWDALDDCRELERRGLVVDVDENGVFQPTKDVRRGGKLARHD